MRIAIGGIAIECCTFSPLPSRLEDFRIQHGDEFRDRYPFLAEYFDVEFVPLLRAQSLPGGSVEASAYATIKAEFLALLAQHGPFDGVYLDMHGAIQPCQSRLALAAHGQEYQHAVFGNGEIRAEVTVVRDTLHQPHRFAAERAGPRLERLGEQDVVARKHPMARAYDGSVALRREDQRSARRRIERTVHLGGRPLCRVHVLRHEFAE